MSKRPKKSNLLGVITQAFIVLSTPQEPDYVNDKGQTLFFSDSFPDFLRQQICNNHGSLEPLNLDVIEGILNKQEIQPCWCFIRVLNGYILIMRSEERSKTLLQWVEPDIGKHCVEEARQQNRFVDASHISFQASDN